jgi:signal recognition particle subunit SRP54
MSMMPGLPEEFVQMGDKEGTQRLKKFMCMFDSMNEKELHSDGKMFKLQTSRIYRVAMGSGTLVREVEEMLMQCTKFAEVVKKMGGSKGLLKQLGGGGGGKVNPNQMANLQGALNKMMPPGMMEQMGGMGGIQQMMQQMTQGGGMANLANMFGGGSLGGLGGALGGLGNMPGARPGQRRR